MRVEHSREGKFEKCHMVITHFSVQWQEVIHKNWIKVIHVFKLHCHCLKFGSNEGNLSFVQTSVEQTSKVKSEALKYCKNLLEN